MNRPLLLTLLLAFTAPVLQAQTARQLWAVRYDGPANQSDSAYAVVVDANGDVVVTGYSEDSGRKGDCYTAKYAAATGALLWEKRYNGPSNGYDSASALAVDTSGNVIITGYSESSGGNSNYYTAKYAAADGALLWEKRYDGPFNDGGGARALALDASGNVIVTGNPKDYNPLPFLGFSQDYYTAKYAAADGALIWEARYNGPSHGEDSVSDMAVDASGNVIVTGVTQGSKSRDSYTAKYAAATGALLWEASYIGPAKKDDGATAVAVDGSGDVIVTGYSNGSVSGSDFYTAKYAAANGALLWERLYNGPSNSADRANAVAVDASGNAIVTGYSITAGSSYGYYTAKYAAANGALLWEKIYNATGISDEISQAVKVDASGNVVVTGYTGASPNGTGNGDDFYTAKYAAATGALLWEARYNGPANKTDRVSGSKSLALTSDGGAVVCGSSFNGTNYDYATVRYAPPNLIDYAFGLDPANGSSQLPQWAVSNSTITTTFTQPPGVTGITYGAEWTTDLAAHPWIPIPDTGTGGSHTFSVPIGPDPRKFFRFTVSQP